MVTRISFVLFSLCLCGTIFSQTSLRDTFPEVLVTGSRLPLAEIGRQVERVDSADLSAFRADELGELFLLDGQFQVRNNGIGLSTSTGMRGGTGVQTVVLWNELNIQNPTLGLVDLSLLPTFFADELQVEYGGSAALWGNGAVGGTVHLTNERPYGQGLQLGLHGEFGSFTRGQGGLTVNYGGERFTSSTRVFMAGGRNDFPFDSSGVERTREHMRTRQWGILQDNALRLAHNQEVGLHLWYQEADREVPGSIAFPSEGFQDDQIVRILGDYRLTNARFGLIARLGYTRDRIQFELPAFDLNSDNRGEQLIGEVETRFQLAPRHQLRAGLNNTWLRGTSTNYPEEASQNRTALFAAYTWLSRDLRWQLNLSARQEVVDGEFVPFVPSLGLEGALTDWLTLKAAASRNYRLPVLDDLFYNDGFSIADPELEAEQGWSQEAGLVAQKQPAEGFSWRLSSTFFNRNMDNWIAWLPDSNFVFSPRNIREVWSRGLENEVEMGYTARRFHTRLSLRYDWIRSTIEEDEDPESPNLGNQLPYVPEHKVVAALLFGYGPFQFTYRHNYTDVVFGNDANSLSVPAFHLGQIRVDYMLRGRWGRLTLYGALDNVWDTDYQLVAGYPQPGRMVEGGFSFWWE